MDAECDIALKFELDFYMPTLTTEPSKTFQNIGINAAYIRIKVKVSPIYDSVLWGVPAGEGTYPEHSELG